MAAAAEAPQQHREAAGKEQQAAAVVLDPLEEEEYELEARVARLLHREPPQRRGTEKCTEDPFAGWPEQDRNAREWGERWRSQDPLDRIPLPYDWDPSPDSCVCNQESVVLWVFGEKFRAYTSESTLRGDEADRRDAIACQEQRGWDGLATADDRVTGMKRAVPLQVRLRDGIKDVQELCWAELRGRCNVVFAEGMIRHPAFLLRTISAARSWAVERRAREKLIDLELRGRARLHLAELRLNRSAAEGGLAIPDLETAATTIQSVVPQHVLRLADYTVPTRWRFPPGEVDSGHAVSELRRCCGAIRAAPPRVATAAAALLGIAAAEAAAVLLIPTEPATPTACSPQAAQPPEAEGVSALLQRLHREKALRHRWRRGGGPRFLLLAELPRTRCADAACAALARFVRAREGRPDDSLQVAGAADPAADAPIFTPEAVVLAEAMWRSTLIQSLTGAANPEVTALGDAVAGACTVPGDRPLTPSKESASEWPPQHGEWSAPAAAAAEGGLAPLWCLGALDPAERGGIEQHLWSLAQRHAFAAEQDVAACAQLCAAQALREIVSGRATIGEHLRSRLAGQVAEAGGVWEHLLGLLATLPELGPVLGVVTSVSAWLRGAECPVPPGVDPEVAAENDFGAVLAAALAQPLGGGRCAGDCPAAAVAAALYAASTEQIQNTFMTRLSPEDEAEPPVLRCALRCCYLFCTSNPQGISTIAGAFVGAMCGFDRTTEALAAAAGLESWAQGTVALLAVGEHARCSIERWRMRALCHCGRLHDTVLDAPGPMGCAGLGPYGSAEGEQPQRQLGRWSPQKSGAPAPAPAEAP
eukprot:TRINITY_DN12219_c0_g2_i1.p1 TRINITY_DN12219_c0_g2~~TRINITY_DN12219_c0_g2_i1.p1  ORF type:complete len:858 (+),score=213.17 TRINITY_DN12219_c0_g2_i1:123-2576(+)